MVPLTIPSTRPIFSPANDSVSGRIRGIPPPTAASNRSETPLAAAAANRAGPLAATSSLLAVTTGLPASSALSTRLPAGSRPPISSTTSETPRVVDHLFELVGGVLGREVAGTIEIADRNLDELEIETGLLGDGGPVGQQATSQCAAHNPTTKDADAYLHKAGDGTEPVGRR